ncbi:MAG: class I SAM-dependent methyltransferase [Pedobacter sp.]|nr:MAG: class I SAM-dependent methyltransferase [Pedobacter sp.]
MEKDKSNGEGQDQRSDKLIGFFKETLNKVAPVAGADLYFDKQCQSIIKELSEFQKPVDLLDYGCGNLRLLNALSKSNIPLPEIRYCGTDLKQPSTEGRKLLNESAEFVSIPELHKKPTARFDAAVLMNVIHEISLHDMAVIFEDIRRLLKPGGLFLLVDMSVLPEGEPLALPFFSWELADLFQAYTDCSYTSKTGIPVIFTKIKKEDIYYFPKILEKLTTLVQLKRNTFSDIACRLNEPGLKKRYGDLLHKLSLSGDKVYDLGKLMLMSGHANYRWMEQANRGYPPRDDIENAAIAILELFFDSWQNRKDIISANNIFESLGAAHNYESLAAALKVMTQFGGFFFPVHEPHKPLNASESLEAFQDNYDFNDIKSKGLGWLQSECYERIYGPLQ